MAASKDIFVPDYEWNAHWNSVEESVASAKEFGELRDGYEFTMVRLTVHASTTYRMVDGEPVPIHVAFPDDAVLIEPLP